MVASGWPSVTEIFEELAIADIRDAADALRRRYDVTRGADGFVSLEVSPYLANDTAATILGLCNGKHTAEEVVARVLRSRDDGLVDDVRAFLDAAQRRGWIVKR